MDVGFGLALDFSSANRPLRKVLDGYFDLIDLAAGFGFDSVWAGEDRQAVLQPGHLPSPLLALAAVAARTNLGVGTGVTLVPVWNPLQLAYDASVLDQISGGRFVLGVGLGNPRTMRRYGIDPDDAPARMDEMLAALHVLWSGDDGFSGDHVRVDGVVVPQPFRPGGPPIWVGGSVKRSVERAVEFGEGWYGSTGATFSLIATQADRYRSLLGAAGKDPSSGRVAVNRTTFVAPDDLQARREAEPYVRWIVDFYSQVGRIDPGELDAVAGDPGDALVFVGSPDTVAASIQRYVDAGVNHFNLRVAMGDMPEHLTRRTVTLFGQEVLPRFRN